MKLPNLPCAEKLARASFAYRTKTRDNTDKDIKN